MKGGLYYFVTFSCCPLWWRLQLSQLSQYVVCTLYVVKGEMYKVAQIIHHISLAEFSAWSHNIPNIFTVSATRPDGSKCSFNIVCSWAEPEPPISLAHLIPCLPPPPPPSSLTPRLQITVTWDYRLNLVSSTGHHRFLAVCTWGPVPTGKALIIARWSKASRAVP